MLLGLRLSQRDCSSALGRAPIGIVGVGLPHSAGFTSLAVNLDANFQHKIVVEGTGVRLLIVYAELRQKLKNHTWLYL